MRYGNSADGIDLPSTRFHKYVSSPPPPTSYSEIKFSKHPATGAFRNGFVWSNVQLGTSIVSACLPIYRPLLSKCAVLHARISSSYHFPLSSDRRSSRNSRAGVPSRDGPLPHPRPRYTHFGGPHDDQSRLTKVTGGPVKGAPPVANLPLHSISVRSSIEIS